MKKKLILGWLLLGVAGFMFGTMVDCNGLMWIFILKVILFWVLVAWGYTVINRHDVKQITNKAYNEGIKTGKEIQRISNVIFIYADDGEDEFKITAPNEVIFSGDIIFLTHNIINSHDNNYEYEATSIKKCGKETEVTFTKINKNIS